MGFKGITLKKIFAWMLITQLLYTTGLLVAHIVLAKSISGFWHGEMLAHFLHYEMAVLPIPISLLLFRKFPKVTVGFLLLCAVTASALYKRSRPQVSYAKAISTMKHERLLQVICYNGNTKNTTKKEFVNWLMSKYQFSIPTLFVLIEASPDWRNEMLVLEKKLPNTQLQLSEDNFGIYLASNLNLSKVRIEEYSYEDVPAIQGEISFMSRKFSFAAVHPLPPISNHWFNEREEYLRGVKKWFISQKMPAIACGDFNTTAWTKSYERFTSAPAPFKDTFWGPMRPLTWGLMGLYTSIDFIFYSPEFDIVYAEVGPKLGSDHNVVSSLLRWK